jgi:hypothetical protein
MPILPNEYSPAPQFRAVFPGTGYYRLGNMFAAPGRAIPNPRQASGWIKDGLPNYSQVMTVFVCVLFAPAVAVAAVCGAREAGQPLRGDPTRRRGRRSVGERARLARRVSTRPPPPPIPTGRRPSPKTKPRPRSRSKWREHPEISARGELRVPTLTPSRRENVEGQGSSQLRRPQMVLQLAVCIDHDSKSSAPKMT